MFALYVPYLIYYNDDSNTTMVQCYDNSSHVHHLTLDFYLKDKSDDTTIYVYPNLAPIAIDIRIYYINR